MKKIFAIIIGIVIFTTNMVSAEEFQISNDVLDAMWLSPTTDVLVLDNIKKENQLRMEEDIALYLIAPGYAREKIGFSADDQIMKQQVTEKYNTDKPILKVYYMLNTDYARQYAEQKSFRYLISEENYWAMKLRDRYQCYKPNGMWYDYSIQNNVNIGLDVITDDGIAFLKNDEKMGHLLSDINPLEIIDIKFVVINKYCSCLYIDCNEKEYLVRVYEGFKKDYQNHKIYDADSGWTKNLEMYKLYDAKELLNIISEDTNEMNMIKSTHEEEAESLQKNGLLYGNENGLDLLKPLTRIEAATMLLRALGESRTNETTVQTFADVPATHWGYGAAENAYSLGLIKGIGDNMFAPDDMITGPQFATMVLRAGNYADFNWEEALDILIDEGVISAEEAAAMDFFTRGDMAKIIYEVINKGMFLK